MKALKQIGIISLWLLSNMAIAQKNQSLKSERIQVELNKKVIRDLYEYSLNQRNFEQFNEVISKNYSSPKGEKGIDEFKNSVMVFIQAFPNAKWTLTEMLAEGDKVFVKQKVEGTHKGIFQNIPPTDQFISNEGMAIYELKDGKIISHQILTNQLGFLQQLGAIPQNISLPDSNTIYFVDRFTMPKTSLPEFFERMEMNRSFIRNLEGFNRDERMIMDEQNGNIIVMTVAVWENQKALESAKLMVQEYYQKVGFNPKELYERLDIKMQREIFGNNLK